MHQNNSHTLNDVIHIGEFNYLIDCERRILDVSKSHFVIIPEQIFFSIRMKTNSYLYKIILKLLFIIDRSCHVTISKC